jgi:hypothetical protein
MIKDLNTTTLMNPFFELALKVRAIARALTLIGFLPRISGYRDKGVW